PPRQQAPVPIYNPFGGHFIDGKSAKLYRNVNRLRDKHGNPEIKEAVDFLRVKKYGRHFWVKRLYTAMVNGQTLLDSEQSIHRKRFREGTRIKNPERPIDEEIFDSMDIEAAAHSVFDACLKVHTEGWTRPRIYHREPKRGPLVDDSLGSLERRLEACADLFQCSKAAVDDAIRGGITLRLLVDNPCWRKATKISNNKGNLIRAIRLRNQKRAERRKEAIAQGFGLEDISEDELEPTNEEAAYADPQD
ncbi:hypothetical protein P280DRAFT_364927, partial [Massarina eburnea CBS 473.64]